MNYINKHIKESDNIRLTKDIMPSMASQRLRLDVGRQSKSVHTYGVSWLNMRPILPLQAYIIDTFKVIFTRVPVNCNNL